MKRYIILTIIVCSLYNCNQIKNSEMDSMNYYYCNTNTSGPIIKRAIILRKDFTFQIIGINKFRSPLDSLNESPYYMAVAAGNWTQKKDLIIMNNFDTNDSIKNYFQEKPINQYFTKPHNMYVEGLLTVKDDTLISISSMKCLSDKKNKIYLNLIDSDSLTLRFNSL